MAKVSVSTTLPVSARVVWGVIGGFNNLAQWHPGVVKSEEVKEGGATTRRLTLQGGGTIVERLEEIDDRTRTYTYSIVEGPLPVAGYTARLHVEESHDGRSCTVEWSSAFEPAGAAEPEAVKLVRRIYEAGFDSLRKMFG
jgi:Polyketide cyclase / dehydrase and lipid transport